MNIKSEGRVNFFFFYSVRPYSQMLNWYNYSQLVKKSSFQRLTMPSPSVQYYYEFFIRSRELSDKQSLGTAAFSWPDVS